MSVIILGSNGMLGSMIYFLAKTEYSHIPIITISKSDFDVLYDNMSNLESLLCTHDCKVIINCIGAIPQKKYTPHEYNIINTTFPQDLSIYCKDKGISLIHVSTNCVFSGAKDMCLESDKSDASDIYGETKYLGEPSYGLVIRCSIVGLEKHTFCGLIEWFLHNESTEINGFTDSFWNGLTTLELSHIILTHINNNTIEDKLIHYYSENSLSKYDILTYVNNIFNKNAVINKKENGIKFYTLSSIYTKPRKNIYKQIDDLYSTYAKYKAFYNL